MKKVALIFISICLFAGTICSQDPRLIFDRDSISNTLSNPAPPANNVAIPSDTIPGDSLNKILPPMPQWRIDARTGERIPVPTDTSYINFHQEALVDGQGVAVEYLGNWGSPAQSHIFSERPSHTNFNFLDPFVYYYKRPDNQVFLDIKKPLANFNYWSGGSRQGKEERFTGAISMSPNKHFNIGLDVDYVYSRGYYTSLSNKQINYDIYASYRSDKYQMHLFVANNNFTNLENGGLKDLPPNFSNADTKNLETNMTGTHNYLRGRHLYMTHKYSVGYEDSLAQKFVPVASFFLTTHYTDQKRRFNSNDVQILDDSIYSNIYDTQGVLNDRMSYYSFKNTLGISLNEGFRKWVKFGLTAFIEQDIRKFTMPAQVYPSLSINRYSENATAIGAILSKQAGKHLQYRLSADLGVLGNNLGETNLKADISTSFSIAGKDAIVKANGYIKKLKPTFYQEHFMSRYYKWDNSFSDIQRTYAGGEIHFPYTQTRISGGVENIKNFIYYNKENKAENQIVANSVNILQTDKNVQVVSLRLDQKLKAGILHWDNQLVFQTSSNEDVLPLPRLSLYSNLYVLFKIAKVLNVQMGADVHYYSKYYAQAYDPALLQFYNQRETKIGNFPFSTAYINLHLKKTRFYVMMYNIGQQTGNSNYFGAPGYLVNPMIFKFGLSWNFTN